MKKKDDTLYSFNDWEFSSIIKSQLLILQNAIVENNTMKRQLEEQNKKLVEIDKLRSEFLANVSHELKTPLNSIIGFSTALRSEMAGKMNDKQKSYANKILSSAVHLTGLINDILDMAKIESNAMKINLKQTEIHPLLDEIVNTIEPLCSEKDIKIETVYKFKGCALIDCVKFKQIIYNILGNAIKFSHPHSKVIIKTENKDDLLIIKIKDFGVGIDKKDRKKIFDKFVQLDNVYTKTTSSTGLGLTITNELVKLHKGSIRLSSALNKGSTFTVKFLTK